MYVRQLFWFVLFSTKFPINSPFAFLNLCFQILPGGLHLKTITYAKFQLSLSVKRKVDVKQRKQRGKHNET